MPRNECEGHLEPGDTFQEPPPLDWLQREADQVTLLHEPKVLQTPHDPGLFENPKVQPLSVWRLTAVEEDHDWLDGHLYVDDAEKGEGRQQLRRIEPHVLEQLVERLRGRGGIRSEGRGKAYLHFPELDQFI